MLENLLNLAPLVSKVRLNAERLAARLVVVLMLTGISIVLGVAAIGFSAFALDRALVSGAGESGAAAITAGILAIFALIGWLLALKFVRSNGAARTAPPVADLGNSTTLAVIALLGGIAASAWFKRRD